MRKRLIPGFGLTLGYTVLYLSLIVLIPLGWLVIYTAELGFSGFIASVNTPRVWSALRLTFGCALAAATINIFAGLLVAWVLVRYRFPGRKLADALVDLPFALPTAVAGIALTSLYAPNGLIGAWLPFQVAFTPLGVTVALTFIGLPFVVRMVEPVLAEMTQEEEEAAASLGATPSQTFWRVILPTIFPALITGFALALARALGEYGSVIFIAGNVPFVSEIMPLLIIIRLEQYNYLGATALATLMLSLSFVMLLLINGLQNWARSRYA